MTKVARLMCSAVQPCHNSLLRNIVCVAACGLQDYIGWLNVKPSIAYEWRPKALQG